MFTRATNKNNKLLSENVSNMITKENSTFKKNPVNNEAYFQYLRKRPFLAWPTIIQMFASLFTIASVWFFALSNQIHLGLGLAINCIAYYLLFAPIHDGIHNSLSSNKKINDALSFFAFLPMCFFLPIGNWMRMHHLQHHRHAGHEENDPDFKISNNGTHAFWKWFVWGLHYRAFFVRHYHSLPKIKPQPFAKTRIWTSILLAIVLFYLFPLEQIFLALLPMMIGISWMIAFIFSYLPHHVHKKTDKENALDDYQATCNITGYEWLLSPLMQYQNYHLAHHLYPTVPFYRMHKIWLARLDKHQEHNPAEIKLS